MDNKSNAIYPSGGRMHYMVRPYADIAVENYKKANSLYREIEAAGFKELNLVNQYEEFCHCIVISIVFSAMAIEAFINNYGAACLGDDFFYENFDRLSVIGKLQLISKFLLKKELDKSKEYYYCLKTTFSERDKFIHSKTISTHDYLIKNGYTIHHNIEDALDSLEYMRDDPILDQEDMKVDLKLSYTAIKAMKNIADYFDENDSNVHAKHSFFRVGGLYAVEPSIFHDVYQEFGIV